MIRVGSQRHRKKKSILPPPKIFTNLPETPCIIAAFSDTVKADSHIACRAHAVPLTCRAAKGFRMCLSHLIYTVRPCLIHKNVKCESDTAALRKSNGKGTFKTLSSTAWQGNGMGTACYV
jgi:hypothetical protein